jgi:hypothetical protein
MGATVSEQIGLLKPLQYGGPCPMKGSRSLICYVCVYIVLA